MIEYETCLIQILAFTFSVYAPVMHVIIYQGLSQALQAIQTVVYESSMCIKIKQLYSCFVLVIGAENLDFPSILGDHFRTKG